MWQTLLTNVAGGSRRVHEGGIDYLVSPISLMTPGVRTSAANGFNVLYNEENLKRNPSAWNGIPATAGHPKIKTPDGQIAYVSVQHEDFADKTFGELRSVTYANGLRGELWIVIDKAATLAPGLVNQLEAGTKVEISIGAGGTVKSWNGTYEGASYNVVAQDLQPDHVAVLLNGVGSCSISKGCGLNNESLPQFSELYRAELVRRGLSEIQITLLELSHWQIQWELRDQLVARFTQAEPSVWIEDVYDDHFIFSQNGELFQLSYTKNDSGVTIGSEDPVQVTRDVNFIPVTNEESQIMDKKTLVAWLINNSCGCWKQGDESLLMSFTNEKLAELKASAENHQLLINEKTPATPPSREQWLAQAPEDIKQTVAYATQLQNEARTTLINQVVATTSLDDVNKTTLAAELSKKGLDDLRLINNIVTHQAVKAPVVQQPSLFNVQPNGSFVNPFASLVNQQMYKDGVADILPDNEISWAK